MAFLLQFLFYPEGNGLAAGILTLSLVTLSLDLSLIQDRIPAFAGMTDHRQKNGADQHSMLSSHLGLLYQPFKLVNGAAYSLGASFFK